MRANKATICEQACSAERFNYIVRGHGGLRTGCTGGGAEPEGALRGEPGAAAELALNLARLEASGSMRGKLKRAGWDDGYLISILSQFTKIHMR